MIQKIILLRVLRSVPVIKFVRDRFYRFRGTEAANVLPRITPPHQHYLCSVLASNKNPRQQGNFILMCGCKWWYSIHRCLLKGVWRMGIAVITFESFPRVESFPAVYPVCLKQMLPKHEPSPCVGSRGRYRSNGDKMSCWAVAKYQRHFREIRSLYLCVGKRMGKTSLGKEANGGVGRASVILNVVVTGANRGLGFAVADRMACLGHRVVLACRSECEVRTEKRVIKHVAK